MRIGNQDYQFCLSSDDALDSGNRSVRLLSLLILSVVTAVTDLKLRHSVRSLTSPYNLVPSLTLKSPLFLMVICFSITPAFAWNGLNTTTVLSVSSNAVTVGTAVVFTATVTGSERLPGNQSTLNWYDFGRRSQSRRSLNFWLAKALQKKMQ